MGEVVTDEQGNQIVFRKIEVMFFSLFFVTNKSLKSTKLQVFKIISFYPICWPTPRKWKFFYKLNNNFIVLFNT